jgi:pyruvate/2-oxoglutarate dehydrogenase complex dihydrolipoamide acyltransferase (E2) component
MQQEKFVLPKFTVPGQRNWLVWVLAGVGGLVVVNMIVLGVVVARGRGAQAAAAAATPPKMDEAPLAPSATPVPPQAKTALAATAAPAADVAAKEEAPSKPAKTSSRRAHHAHGKALAHAGVSSGHHSVAGKGDALDELLKKFK